MTLAGLRPLFPSTQETWGFILLPCLHLVHFWPLLQAVNPYPEPSFPSISHRWILILEKRPCVPGNNLCHYPMIHLLLQAYQHLFRKHGTNLLHVESCFSSLVTKADPQGKARLLVSQQKESGACLSAPPLGLRMLNDTIRIATSRHLGTPICFPHGLLLM